MTHAHTSHHHRVHPRLLKSTLRAHLLVLGLLSHLLSSLLLSHWLLLLSGLGIPDGVQIHRSLLYVLKQILLGLPTTHRHLLKLSF